MFVKMRALTITIHWSICKSSAFPLLSWGPKCFGLKHRGISSFSNSVISCRHFSHCGRIYSGMGLSQSNLSLHICWSICFPLSVTGAMYPLGSYMEPTVDKMPCQVKSKTSRPEIFLVWICVFCSYIVSIGAELTALVDLTICKEFQTWNWHLNGRLGLHTAIFPCLALPLAWPTLDNRSVIKSSVLIWNLAYTHTIRENCTVLCSFSVKAGGMHLWASSAFHSCSIVCYLVTATGCTSHVQTFLEEEVFPFIERLFKKVTAIF